MDYLTTLSDEYFNKGMTMDEYVSGARNYRSFVRQLMEKAEVKDNQVQRLQELKKNLGELRVTVNTEDWCGDWACNAPILGKLFSEAGVEMRIFRGSEFPLLKERYERDGDDHIPAVSIWNRNGDEMIRWIEAPAAVAEKKDRWKKEHPEFTRTYALQKEDPKAKKEFAVMYRNFLDMMGEWYSSGMWDETVREILEKLEKQQ
ncbi:thioredoxin family protein [Salinispira pacifica]|uniref:Thioredoxin n=1 Tax=Salinispira pacifica TaxID=1307761 RepID=V5WK14_9SPIO|nr:thioredoxin family protein [Salinispira pacifica]AHC15501.1 Thioredoxin [Salinispira pacifica]